MADSSDETEALSHDLDELRLRDESEKIGLELLHRASEFLLELEKFRKYIASSPHARSVSLKHFRTAAEAEYKSLEKVSAVNGYVYLRLTCSSVSEIRDQQERLMLSDLRISNITRLFGMPRSRAEASLP